MTSHYRFWGALWRSDNALDGVTEHLLLSTIGAPLLWKTRALARAYIEDAYGYIRSRPDLRAEPHGWKMPRAVRVELRMVTKGGAR